MRFNSTNRTGSSGAKEYPRNSSPLDMMNIILAAEDVLTQNLNIWLFLETNGEFITSVTMASNLILPSMHVLYADPYGIRQQTNTIFNGRPVKTQGLAEVRHRQFLKRRKFLDDGERSLAGNMQHKIQLTDKQREKRVITFV